MRFERVKTGTEFRKYGEIFTPIEHNEELDTWLYRRTNGCIVSYEVVNGEYYPSSSQFGFGRAVYTPIYERALKYLNNGIQRIQ